MDANAARFPNSSYNSAMDINGQLLYYVGRVLCSA